ncbi:MAG: hypothetical protein AB8C95_08630, partial [Phycisphaeraceae bacterium]
MKNNRDNLILIGAFAAAIALHAVTLPWVGAAVGEARPVFDLEVKKLEVSNYARSGESIAVYATVLGQEDVSESDIYDLGYRRSDLIWLSRDRSHQDTEDIRLDVIGLPFCSWDDPWPEDFERTVELPSEVDGPYWIIYRTDQFENFDDPDRSNNTRVAPIFIDGPQRPELSIQTFSAPDRAASGGSV